MAIHSEGTAEAAMCEKLFFDSICGSVLNKMKRSLRKKIAKSGLKLGSARNKLKDENASKMQAWLSPDKIANLKAMLSDSCKGSYVVSQWLGSANARIVAINMRVAGTQMKLTTADKHAQKVKI